MTYHTIYCPHCKNVVDRGSGGGTYIGNPLRQCPHCGQVYVSPFAKEWVTMKPLSRKIYIADRPVALAFLAFLAAFAVCFAVIKMQTAFACIAAVLIALAVAVLYATVRKKRLQDDINSSLARTRNADYVDQLIRANFKIYPVKGVEVGTEHDSDATESDNGDTQF